MKDLRSPVLIVITIPLSLVVTLLAFHVLGNISEYYIAIGVDSRDGNDG